MKLSLSVRIAESASRKDKAAIPIELLAPAAAAVGFEGLSMRASVVSITSPPERVRAVRALLDAQGLAVSLVTGDIPIAANTPDAVDHLRNITPYLDLAAALGCPLIRVMMHSDDDIPHAQRSADEAAERGIGLAHQTHNATTFETVDDALDVVRRVGRPNFGITYEPANLLACGAEYGPDQIARVAPHLFNVYFSNIRLSSEGAHTFRTRRRGPVALDYVSLRDRDAIDPVPLIAALKKEGYAGWFTVHQPLMAGQTVEQAIDEAYGVFAPLLSRGGTV